MTADRKPSAQPDSGEPGAAPSPYAGGRLRYTREWLESYLRRIPFSLLMVAVFLVSAVFSRSLFGENVGKDWGLGVDTTLLAGKWWTPLTALVVPRNLMAAILTVFGSILVLGPAERTLGSRRAALAFFATGLAGGVLGVLFQWLGTLTWEWWATSSSATLTVDPLTGVLGALSAATAGMDVLWRRRVRVVLLVFALIFLLYSGDPEDLYRLVAVLTGLPLGGLFAARRRPLRVSHSSHRETRRLVAAVVLVTAVGPVVAYLGSTDPTPFAFGSYLFMSDPVDVSSLAEACQGNVPLSRACVRQLAQIGSQGPGMFVLSFVPVVLLGIAAWGLYRGRRFGWWLAVSVNAAILLFAPGSFSVVRVIAQSGTGVRRPFSVEELVVWAVTAALVPVASLLMLLMTRKNFAVKAPAHDLHRFWSVLVTGFLVLLGVYILVALGALSSMVPKAGPGQVLLEAPRRFVPPHFLGGPSHVALPRHSAVSFAYQWSGPAFWVLFVLAALWLLARSPRMAVKHDDEAFRALVRRHGGGSLGHMTTWDGNTPWFTRDGTAGLAYRVVNDHAIVLGGPVCAGGDEEATVREFAAFCDEHHWKPLFYSFPPAVLPVFEALGWWHMPVGEETVVHLDGFSLKGKHWQNVRTALNKALKQGTRAVWTSWAELPFSAATEIVAISEAWVAENKLPEMGFTLGGVDELKDPAVRLMLAVGPDRRVEAVTSWMPVYEDGKTIGWTLDFMRRSPASFNGVMEFLIASAALHLQGEGYRFMSLSGAPLAAKPATEDAEAASGDDDGVDAFLEWLARTLEPAYGFRSLFRFKSKFHPEYVTLSMAFPDVMALPGIGMALARAYLPDVSTRETMALLRVLGRQD